MSAFFLPSRLREGTEGWAPAHHHRYVSGEREPTPSPSRKREGRKK